MRPVIQDGPRRYTGNTIITNDSTHISQIIGNAIIVDTTEATTVIAGEVLANNETGTMLAFNKPLMIVKQDQDSIFITADTLFSARLSDLYKAGDSVKTLNAADSTQNATDSIQKDTVNNLRSPISPKESIRTNPKSQISDIPETENSKTDSTDRYFQGFYHVRIFSDSVQAVSDSMFYSFKDSVFRLYKDPVVWSKENQVTGDTILLFTKNKKADRFKVFENSLLISKVQGDFFNQVKS